MMNPLLFYIIFYPVWLNIFTPSNIHDPFELVIKLNQPIANL